ncbi:signal recognition particle-docking protein FtsY [Corynebacterium lubricantis]|uniref:signal recognition particle-docking protein FtsY n=1 Tax=Corynebacterium lubricantis TaxID=541095 RepID=UPI00036D64C9|nr:signal recognition particle-docking protein FtsY [Corynebacterium lubricantis]
MDALMLWIIIAIVVILLIIVGIIIVGNNRKKSKTVSFEKKEEDQPKELTQQEKSGNYQAKGGFNFAPATAPEKEPVLREPAVEPQQREATVEPVKPVEPKAPQSPQSPQEVKPLDKEPKVAPLADQPRPAAAEKAAAVEPKSEPEEAPTEPAEELSDDLSGEVKKPQANEESQRISGASQAVAAGASGAVIAGAASAAQSDERDKDQEAEQVEPEVEAVAEPVAEPESQEDQEDQQEKVSEESAQPVEPAEPVTQDEEAPVFEEVAEQQTAESEAGAESGTDSQLDESIDRIPEIEQETLSTEEEAREAADVAQVTAAGADQALEETPVPEGEPAPASEPLDEIEPASGRIGRLRGRLSRSQNAIGQGLLGILTAGDLDEDAWEEIEDTLIMADLGADLTMKVTDSLRAKIAERGVSSEDEARAMLRETLIEAGQPDLDRSIKAMPVDGKPAVILIVGVNGTGKTTTTGKLGRVLVSMGHKVLFGAADTFRAAAADQLETWGKRVGATTVRGAEGADPASVAYDAVAKGVEEQADVVLIDTAGRLHTATGLMDQLGKVKRVVEKKSHVDEVLLVLDATVGQNGLTQARVFRDVVNITGVVLTKLDGTAKGGIVFQVQEELGVPVKLVGLGEGADDLAPFEVEGFVDALLG